MLLYSGLCWSTFQDQTHLGPIDTDSTDITTKCAYNCPLFCCIGRLFISSVSSLSCVITRTVLGIRTPPASHIPEHIPNTARRHRATQPAKAARRVADGADVTTSSGADWPPVVCRVPRAANLGSAAGRRRGAAQPAVWWPASARERRVRSDSRLQAAARQTDRQTEQQRRSHGKRPPSALMMNEVYNAISGQVGDSQPARATTSAPVRGSAGSRGHRCSFCSGGAVGLGGWLSRSVLLMTARVSFSWGSHEESCVCGTVFLDWSIVNSRRLVADLLCRSFADGLFGF